MKNNSIKKALIDRRQFLIYAGGGIATIVLGACGGGGGGGGGSSSGGNSSGNGSGDGNGGGNFPSTQDPIPVTPVIQAITFRITDAMKDMVTHNSLRNARCYFWIYKSESPHLDADCPGPNIIAFQGDVIRLTLTNDLDEPHALHVPGMFSSGPVAPGATQTFEFTLSKTGTFLYYDNLNEPVNRVMGLHGALVVMPRQAVAGHKFTPFSNPTTAVQQLFDDLGTAEHWPGLAWEEADNSSTGKTPAFRQYIWLCHQASPLLFQEVGQYPAGQDYPAATFVDAFLNDPYVNSFKNGSFNKKAHFFTINGQSGHFSHNNPYICPNNRVGEPVIIRCLNAGLHMHSLHIHANHVFVLAENNVVRENPLWVDSYTLHALDTYEWLVPYIRPPDIPNVGGIGRADTPLTSPVTGKPVWPPDQELNTFIPPKGTIAGNGVDLSVQLSPLCYPMHDHSEASQSAQGGNYNCGLISGINFTGDRNAAGGVMTFPNAPDMHGPESTGPATVEFAGHGH
ncbi:MAG: multicopper oxidase domain-containing protein [Nitrospirae bacterium]|nr:multicopper oxidase domain-containing protein [Nitrospirota bacterium]